MLTNRSTLATILGVAALGIASKLKKGSANEGKILIFSSFKDMRNWIKEGWANPEEVTVIHLKDAKISSLPQDILVFKNLEHIYLNNNQFTKLPLILNELNKLRHINLSGNFLDQNSLQDLIYFSGPNSEAKAILTFGFSNNPIDNIPLIVGDLASGKYGRIINTSFYNPYDHTPYDKSYLPNLTYDDLVQLVERGFTRHFAVALAYAKGFIPVYEEDEVSPEYIVNLLRTNKLFCYLADRIVFNLTNMENRTVILKNISLCQWN